MTEPPEPQSDQLVQRRTSGIARAISHMRQADAALVAVIHEEDSPAWAQVLNAFSRSIQLAQQQLEELAVAAELHDEELRDLSIRTGK